MGSFVLIVDVLYNFLDMVLLVIVFVVCKIVWWFVDECMIFGYGWIEIVVVLINYMIFIFVGVYLIYEGGMCMIDLFEV